MKKILAAILFGGGAISGLVIAQGTAPAPISPDALAWTSPPKIPALRAAWMLGAEGKSAPYILRVKLAAGGRIPPHAHPDERSTTVLSGAIYVGFGETFDESEVVAVPAGWVYVAPANVPHYVWAKDGDAIYQEAGVGPTGTSFVERR